MAKKENYLNNRDMLAEIHKSKTSYCEFIEPEYHQWDVIIRDKNDIFDEDVIQKAKENQADRLTQTPYQKDLKAHKRDPKNVPKPKLAEYRVKSDSISIDDLVFRVITYEHIPKDPDRKKNPKRTADYHVKLNFIPFKHYIIEDFDNGIIKEVGKSHTKNGKFCMTHGAMTDKLAKMFMLLVNRYSQRSNWRGYSYLSEMKGQALLQLSHMGLQFNEEKSNNPFSYFTAVITNSFTGVLNSEKRHQNTRDDLLEQQGKNPSYTRQLEHVEAIRKMREEAENED